MPSEIRHLLFRPAEVIHAVKEYYRRRGEPLPTGSIVRCGPEVDGAGVRFRIELALDPAKDQRPGTRAEDKRTDIIVDGSELAAALILHCRDRRIPLPVSANKKLEHYGQQTCLVATLNPNQDELPSSEELKL